ncbi:hypothetical protein CAAN1_15S00980 [[Candida] anglica]|uniref:Major facilitator superfamily (MFS) profile domain-containing protein n=1 Tax=[Candida] anglica TaxID=148631 RepID=A0ABP0EBA5_9ASCO
MTSETTPLVQRPLSSDPDDILEEAVTDAYVGFLDDDDEDDEVDDEVLWLREQRDQNKSLPWNKRPSVLLVGLGMFCTALATSSAEPSRASIMFKLACNTLIEESNSGMCDPTDTQMLVSNLSMAVSVTTSIVMMIASGKVGPLSDQYGRKLFIGAIIGSMFLGKVIQLFAFNNSQTLPFYWIIVSDVIGNITGGVLTMVALVNSYISDVVEPNERIYSLGLSVATLYIGLSLGPIVGSLLVTLPGKFNPKPAQPNLDKLIITSSTDSTTVSIANEALNTSRNISSTEFIPLKFEIGLLVVIFLYCIFLLPESRSEKARMKSRTMSRTTAIDLAQFREENRQSLFSKFLDLFSFLKPLRLLTLPADVVSPTRLYRLKKDRLAVMSLVFVDCINAAMGMALGNIFMMYGIYKFQWNSAAIGRFMAIACSSRAIVLIVLSPVISHTLFHKTMGYRIMKKQLDLVDWSTAFFGLCTEGFGLALMLVINSTNGILLVLAIHSFGAIFNPAANSAVIKLFPESKVGEYFGAMSLLKNMFSLAGPLIFLSLYKYSISKFGNVTFLFTVISGLNLLNIFIMLILKRVLNLSETSQEVARSNSSSRRPSMSDMNTSTSPSEVGMIPQPLAGSSKIMNQSYAGIQRSSSFIEHVPAAVPNT